MAPETLKKKQVFLTLEKFTPPEFFFLEKLRNDIDRSTFYAYIQTICQSASNTSFQETDSNAE